ncbi:MAG TPA: hypothetical protein VKQ30_14685 [Ktedonobacterales bacterium]|nr:hypothetical protein [Ktedonobacterales bacterium]
MFVALLSARGIWMVRYYLQQPYLNDSGEMKLVFVVLAAVLLGCLAMAIYWLWSLRAVRNQVLVITPNGFATTCRPGPWNPQRFTVAFDDLLSLTARRAVSDHQKCLELCFTTPVVSLPDYWFIPPQFAEQDAIAQAIVEAYMRYRHIPPLQPAPTSVG